MSVIYHRFRIDLANGDILTYGYKTVIFFHTFCDLVPPGCIQRIVRTPGDVLPVSLSGAIFVPIRWSILKLRIQFGVFANVAIPCMRVYDLKSLAITMLVKVCRRCDKAGRTLESTSYTRKPELRVLPGVREGPIQATVRASSADTVVPLFA